MTPETTLDHSLAGVVQQFQRQQQTGNLMISTRPPSSNGYSHRNGTTNPGHPHLEQDRCNAEYAENADYSEGSSTPPTCAGDMSPLCTLRPLCCIPLSDEVASLIDRMLPEEKWDYQKKLFEFARHLKAIPEYAEAEPADLRSVVRQWHDRCLPIVGPVPFEDTLMDFTALWPKVKWAAGAGPMDEMLRRAKEREPPSAVAHYERVELQQLAALCRELQHVAGDKPFPLACRVVGDLFDINHVTAARWLAFLVSDRVIRLVKKGSTDTIDKRGGPVRQASEYLYVGD